MAVPTSILCVYPFNQNNLYSSNCSYKELYSLQIKPFSKIRITGSRVNSIQIRKLLIQSFIHLMMLQYLQREEVTNIQKMEYKTTYSLVHFGNKRPGSWILTYKPKFYGIASHLVFSSRIKSHSQVKNTYNKLS